MPRKNNMKFTKDSAFFKGLILCKNAFFLRKGVGCMDVRGVLEQSYTGFISGNLTKSAKGFEETLGAQSIEKVGEKNEEKPIQDLGIGFVFVGQMGIGMHAHLMPPNADGDKIVRVSMATRDDLTVDVNVSKVDPRNASAIEMFAFCQYADATGTGVDDTWGSWHALKSYAVNYDEVLEYDTFEAVIDEKQNWLQAMSKNSDTVYGDKNRGKVLEVSDVFSMLKETIMKMHDIELNASEKEKDWRSMDEEEWEDLVKEIDKYIDQAKDILKEEREMKKDEVEEISAGKLLQ